MVMETDKAHDDEVGKGRPRVSSVCSPTKSYADMICGHTGSVLDVKRPPGESIYPNDHYVDKGKEKVDDNPHRLTSKVHSEDIRSHLLKRKLHLFHVKDYKAWINNSIWDIVVSPQSFAPVGEVFILQGLECLDERETIVLSCS
ncbi:hypothetical protein KP509_31G013600 [Ceratopteris richardii]|nr:hypothetical protein KP509_31G013600 [Ceratopteris richardii]